MVIENFAIYKIIQKCSEDLALSIKNAYKVAEKILDYVTVYFPDETDHKIGHSLRILKNIEDLLLGEEIKRLAENESINSDLVEEKIDLNVEDLYFLVLGALFHDIGMCPDKEMFKEVAKEALGKEVTLQEWKLGKLCEKDIKKIRNHIKENHGKISAKMIVRDCLDYEDELTKTLSYKIELDDYHKELLAVICEGHKVELDKLRKFIEEEKGLRDTPIKLEEIIVLLKLADDLDITKKRTPDLFYDLYVKGESSEEIERVWKAHKYVFKPKREGHIIKIFGRFDDPEVYAQFVKYIGKVRRRFELAQLIKISEKVKSILPVTINIDGIIKKGFVAIDIKLNLAGNEIIELLSSHLYGNDWKASIREVLQNAIDACKYRALKEFERRNYNYKPKIEIKFDGDVLTVKDNGKGMTLDEIERFLLNIGRCYYSELDQKILDDLNPISRFGIGILSCFMLTDKIEVETKSMFEDKAYRVEIGKNIDDPVIVWEASKDDIGTEIRLKLKEDVKDKIIKDVLEKLRTKEDFVKDKDQNELLVNAVRETIHNLLVDTKYKIKGREVAIEICFNKECWIPTIESKANEIHKRGGEVILKFNCTNDDFKSYVVVSFKVAGKNYLAYNGISCNITNLPLQNIINPFKHFGLNIILDLRNRNYIKSFSLARDKIVPHKEAVEYLINILNEKFLCRFIEYASERNILITDHKIKWDAFNVERHKKLLDKIVFDCIIDDTEKTLKMSDLIKLSKEKNFDIILCHHTSTLTNRFKKLNNNLIIIVKSDEFMTENLVKVFQTAGINVYTAVDCLIQKQYAKYCLDCLSNKFFPLKVIKILGSSIGVVDTTRCPVTNTSLLKFHQEFTDKLFEVESLDFPMHSIIFNKNHIFIEKLCNTLMNPQTPPDTKQETLESAKLTFKRLDNVIREFTFEQSRQIILPLIGRRLSINTLKREVLNILKPLAERLGVELTEKDLPWD